MVGRRAASRVTRWAPPGPGPAQCHTPGFACVIAWTSGPRSHIYLLVSCGLRARGEVTAMSF